MEETLNNKFATFWCNMHFILRVSVTFDFLAVNVFCFFTFSCKFVEFMQNRFQKLF